MQTVIYFGLAICSIGFFSNILKPDDQKLITQINNGTTNLGFTRDIGVKNKIFINNFVALPPELKKIILGYLSVQELFEFTQNPEFAEYHQLAIEAYGLTYGNTPVFFTGSNKVRPSTHDYFINVREFDSFSLFLSTFNKYIRSIKIDFSQIHRFDLFNLLNEIEYYSETLNRIEFRRFNSHQFKHIETIAFSNVKELSIFGCSFDNEYIESKYTFPSVDKLSIKATTFSSRKWIENSFNNLTKLLIDIHRERFWEEDLISTLSYNLKINTLGIINSTPNLLQQIDKDFSNIKNLGLLKISSEFFDTPIIHMHHIQRLLFVGMIRNKIPIYFENLKELEWQSRTKPEIAFIDFIQIHQQTIEILHIQKTPLSDHHLDEMHNMTQLKKMSIHFEEGTKIQMTTVGMINFIKANENLTEIEIFGVKKMLREAIFETFDKSGIVGWLQITDPKLNDQGHIHIIKATHKPIRNEDSLQFLRSNFF